MAKLSNTKIEQRALNTLESIIDEHLTMTYQFNSQDKEMSWDGYIEIFKINNGDQSKKNFDDRLPVQIKGHIDREQRYIIKNRISYPVKLDDLRAYSTEKGVLYFQIFLSDKQSEVFYTSLYPSKILDYLEKAKKRRRKDSINIPFFILKKSPDVIYNIAKQFSNEGKKQGSGFTPLVQDRIKVGDFNNIKSIKFSAVGAKSPDDVLLRLSSGDVCFYGKTNDDKYERPLEWQDDSMFFLGCEVNRDIAIGEKTYYQHYNCLKNSSEETIIILSPNLKYIISEHKMEFKPVSTLKEIYNDSKFLLHLNESKALSIDGNEITITDTVEKEFEDRLKLYVKLFEIFKAIAFELSIPWTQLTEQHIKSIKELHSVHQKSINILPDGLYKHLWSFDEKYVPIIINKKNNTVEFTHAVYTDKFFYVLPDNEKKTKGFRMPLFAILNAEILSNLYYYDYDLLRNQIDTCDVNEKTKQALHNCVLLLIHVFDLNRDYHFLDLAEYLLEKLEYPENDELTLLNKMQVKKRRGSLDENDIKLLNQMNESDVTVKFGKYVLLENKDNAYKALNQFTKEQKEFYKKAPIYKLYSEL